MLTGDGITNGDIVDIPTAIIERRIGESHGPPQTHIGFAINEMRDVVNPMLPDSVLDSINPILPYCPPCKVVHCCIHSGMVVIIPLHSEPTVKTELGSGSLTAINRRSNQRIEWHKIWITSGQIIAIDIDSRVSGSWIATITERLSELPISGEFPTRICVHRFVKYFDPFKSDGAIIIAAVVIDGLVFRNVCSDNLKQIRSARR